MSGLAVFGFKMPSLLYGVEKAPSDTCMRERLDSVSPQQLRRPFKNIFSYLQRGKALESYRYLNGHYIVLWAKRRLSSVSKPFLVKFKPYLCFLS